MRSEVYSVALSGLVATLVKITITIEPGPSAVVLLGLAEECVRPTKGRVLSALARLGKWLDGYKVDVNFCPVGLGNDGMFDLAIGVAVLMAMEERSCPRMLFLGELGMDAAVRPVRGTLPALLGVKDIPSAVVPWANGTEAASVRHVEVHVAAHLREVIESLQGTRDLPAANTLRHRAPVDAVDMRDIRGQCTGRRALEIAAAGRHPLLFIGSPGSGRTMLTRRLPTVMPPLTEAEALEVTSIHSLAGLLGEHDRLLTYGSLRAPHHSVDAARLVGGGCPARPGEASLAHLGVLFVDDVQEFKEAALSALDEVLGYGISVIREREKRVIFPAGALVVAGALPCPCGFYQTKGRTCTCSPKKIRKYRERLRRQPVVHRSHLRVCLSGDSSDRRAESSAAVRARVVKAREVQRRRFEQGEAGVPLNGWLATQDRARVAKPDGKIRLVLDKAGLLRDAEANVLRVARTIADLDGSDGVLARHVKEALQFAPRPEM